MRACAPAGMRLSSIIELLAMLLPGVTLRADRLEEERVVGLASEHEARLQEAGRDNI